MASCIASLQKKRHARFIQIAQDAASIDWKGLQAERNIAERSFSKGLTCLRHPHSEGMSAKSVPGGQDTVKSILAKLHA